jgi:hypothetical protein
MKRFIHRVGFAHDIFLFSDLPLNVTSECPFLKSFRS